MAIQLVNTTSTIITYSFSGITIPANGSVTPTTAQLTNLYLDPNLHSDIVIGNVNINDSVTIWIGSAAYNILQLYGTSASKLIDSLGNAVTLGNTTMVSSLPVTIASNQSPVPVTASATLNAETTKVIGTVNIASTQTIATTNTGTFAVQATGTVAITPPTLTKGIQGATGLSVQNLKDAGRNQTNYFMAIQIGSGVTEALMSLTGYKGGIAVVATTTPAVVTALKTYRINSITMDYTTIVTTPGSVRFTLRANTAGVVAITSPAVATWEVGEPTGIAPVAGKKNTIILSIPDGLEFAAGTGIGISMVGLNTLGVAAIVGYGRATIQGYEY